MLQKEIVRFFRDTSKKQKLPKMSLVHDKLTSEVIQNEYDGTFNNRTEFDRMKKNLNLSQKQGNVRGPKAAKM